MTHGDDNQGRDPAVADLQAVKPLAWDTIRDLVNRGAALTGARRRTGDGG